jgi:hypothetical protein
MQRKPNTVSCSKLLVTVFAFARCYHDRFASGLCTRPRASARKLNFCTMTVLWLPDNLYHDTAHVFICLRSAIVTNFQLLIKLVPRHSSCSISFVPGLQKHAPCPSRTGTLPGPNGTTPTPVASSGNVY